MLHLLPLAAFLLPGAVARNICRGASSDDINKIPGIEKLKAAITADFGVPPARLLGVDSDPMGVLDTVRADTRNNQTSQICASDGPYDAIIDPSTTSCTSVDAEFEGAYDDATGYYMVTTTSGYEASITYTVTRTSSYGVDFALGLTVNSPKPKIVYGLLGEYGASAEASVTQHWDMSDETSSTATQTLNQNVGYASTCGGFPPSGMPAGMSCVMTMNKTDCTSKSALQVPVKFSGWIRASFDSPQTYAGQGEDNKRTDWWLSPELTYGLGTEDLISTMLIAGSMSTTAQGQGTIEGRYMNATVAPTPTPGLSSPLISNSTGTNSTRKRDTPDRFLPNMYSHE